MQIAGNYTNFSTYYDEIYPRSKYEVECEFVLSQIYKYSPSAKRLIDLGCGTANHALYLIDKTKLDIVCMDISQEMLNVATRKITELEECHSKRIHLVKDDVTTFNGLANFDVAISLFNVVTYFKCNDDLELFFKTTNQSLNDKGLLIFDFWYGPSVKANPPRDSKIEIVNDECHIIRNAKIEMREDDNVVKITYEFDIHSGDGGLMEMFSEVHNIRYYFLEDISSKLNESGFDIVEVYNQDLSPGIIDSDKKCFVIAVKR